MSGVYLKRVSSTLCGVTIVALLTAGCAKHEDGAHAQAAPSGPISDSADTGLRAAPGAAAAKGDPTHGEAIFGQNCTSCHGAAGAGGGIGPKLKGEKGRKNYDAAVAWIKNPQPPMPKLYPSPLSESDVADVAAYVETL